MLFHCAFPRGNLSKSHLLKLHPYRSCRQCWILTEAEQFQFFACVFWNAKLQFHYYVCSSCRRVCLMQSVCALSRGTCVLSKESHLAIQEHSVSHSTRDCHCWDWGPSTGLSPVSQRVPAWLLHTPHSHSQTRLPWEFNRSFPAAASQISDLWRDLFMVWKQSNTSS